MPVIQDGCCQSKKYGFIEDRDYCPAVRYLSAESARLTQCRLLQTTENKNSDCLTYESPLVYYAMPIDVGMRLDWRPRK